VLRHYLLSAWSSFRRGPLAASINALTLALGLLCFLLASSVMGFWSRADQQFANAERTLVMTSEWRLLDGSETGSSVALPLTTDQLRGHLKTDFPRIEAVARLVRLSDTTPIRAGDRTVRMRAFAADAEFLAIFDLPFIAGDARTALASPDSVILTKEAAERLYGDAQAALGKSLTLYGNIDTTVTGVLGRIPEPSHMGRSAAAPLRFDVVASRDVFESFLRTVTGGRDSTQLPEDWLNTSTTTYVLLPKDESFTAGMLHDQLPTFVERHVPAPLRKLAEIKLAAVPVGGLLVMAVRDALFPRESAVSVPLLLLALGSIVLVVACINFANLATARAAGRTREVGVRKAIGAGPRQVVVQHLLEAAMLTLVALVVALALLAALIPVLATATGIDLRQLWSASFAGSGVWSLLLLTIAVTLAAGFYPAFVLSRVQPARALRAAATRAGPRSLTALLVGVQFTFAAFLLIALSIVHEQNKRLERLGRETAAAPLLVIENVPELTGLSHETLRQELARLPQVASVTSSQQVPWTSLVNRISLSSSPSASAVERNAFLYVVGYDFFPTFDIDLLAGRLFDPQRADDVAMTAPGAPRTQNIVVSRSLARELGVESPAAIVNRTIYIPTSLTGETAARPFHVIGVVEDKVLAIASRYGQRPNAYLFAPNMRFRIVRLASNDVGGALRAIDALWNRLVPQVAISRRFLSDYFDDSYANFLLINRAFAAFAVMAWSISTIGLYAMAVLVSGRRVREIAIRKTLGARTGQIAVLLLESFTKPVLVANVIAAPFAYFAGRAYLNVFVDPIALTPWPFIAGLVVSVSISWLAVASQTWRAATAAPMKTIRYE